MRRNLHHAGQDTRLIARHIAGKRVGVGGRPAGVERGQQHAALENEVVGVIGMAEPGQPALHHIKREQFLGSAVLSR
jgi:hypothetical protein